MTSRRADPPVAASNLAFLEQLYCRYREDPESVDEGWRRYFAQIADDELGNGETPRPAADGPRFRPRSIFAAAPNPDGDGLRQDKVDQLINAYRVRGHLLAKLDPLERPRPPVPGLGLDQWGLGETDLASHFSTTTLAGATVLTLQQILDLLQATYCGSIGVQFMHIDDRRAKRWLIDRLEKSAHHRPLTGEEQLRILTKLTDAEIFEQFLHRKFVGAKRFSLEGAETLIPLLDLAIEEATSQGVEELVFGMAHRGRLNVLVNIFGKPPSEVFREFGDQDASDYIGRGDVKYHLGYGATRRTAGGHDVHLSLCFNPSHLEFVNPVVAGRVRAKQDRFADPDHRRCLGVVIHGDAAFAGQGVTQELLNMAALPGYRVGGMLHIVVNNQIGFTTSPESGRSTLYATDVARMLQTPVFHVNGEDPDAVAHVVRTALDFRREFRQDVIVDMYCYRRWGHNEGDEPSFTQPLMAQAIARRATVRESYLERLMALDGGPDREQADEIKKRRTADLEDELSRSRDPGFERSDPLTGEEIWRPFRGGLDREAPEVETKVARKDLASLLRRTVVVPETFHLHPKLGNLVTSREQMAGGSKPVDWSAAEALAFASLVVDGAPVRLSGQDSGRGTFSHRHAVFRDVETEDPWIPLQHLATGQAPFQVWDSPLSEIAVLGFEVGYSLDTPEGLLLWEAQFGDFCNVAQVIIDQFLASSEDKWRRLSGLVLLLPHGFEGQGPEHSSARLERFLSLAAEDNLQIVNLTTPAQLFHCLRRQVLRPFRKPLVVMAPKSLLRHPAAVSTLDELADGRFQRLIPDAEIEPKETRRVLLTSGKLYYELVAARLQAERYDVAILRLEQYYPLAAELIEAALAPYAAGTPVFWVQEEPQNMGAWRYLQATFGCDLFERWPFACVSRPESASPATGSPGAHKQEQAELVAKALGS